MTDIERASYQTMLGRLRQEGILLLELLGYGADPNASLLLKELSYGADPNASLLLKELIMVDLTKTEEEREAWLAAALESFNQDGIARNAIAAGNAALDASA